MNKYVLIVIASVALWGTTIPPTKWALESIPPFTLSFLRLFVACLVLFPLAQYKSSLFGQKRNIPWKRLWSLSFTGVGGTLILGYWGIELTSGLHVSILGATMPIFTLLLGVFYLKESISKTEIVSLLLGLLGVLIISIQSDIDRGSSILGDILILFSCLLWAIYMAQLKRPKGELHLPIAWFTALTLFLGSLMMFPLAIVEIWVIGWPTLTWKVVGSVLYLSLLPTTLAYWLWNKGLTHISMARASVILYTIPIIEIISCVILLDEMITWRLLIGGCLVLGGVVLIEKKAIRNSLIKNN
ncbi:DMT family transporter [Priestia megaterium]|uniref:DMT family transporter n=1 Tax=Priestia megaterium TaxID=1404 RepID=A0A6H1P762_PRIMG|nr:DMT family transporter [Priestia megaterium]QIZ09305.1 DMT family transporter [Priestia megaterium]